MIWRVEVKNKKGIFDSTGEGIKKDIADLGISGVESVQVVQIYIIEGDIKKAQIRKIAQALLADPITQEYSLRDSPLIDKKAGGRGQSLVEVAYNPGVMDPVETSVKKGILDLGIKGVNSVKTAKKYIINGKASKSDLNIISEKLLYNRVIQHIVKSPDSYTTRRPPKYHFKLITVDLLNASDKELERISYKGQLFLNLTEMRQIKDYFSRLGRNPTDSELETLAQTWSEHCRHKTLRGLVDYKYNGKTHRIDNLLKQTIMKVTEELKEPWCVSVFKDNSGVIRFDGNYNVCFKVETHNHPSAIEPYGGANTGIGGVIRDPLGTGLGAKPILSTDVFCFAEPDYPFDKLPLGVLHPKRVMKGVVAGVRDYGNKMGIPTVNGAVLFDNRYLGNPLVYCGNVGLIPKDKSFKVVRSRDLVVLVGGRTGRDGIHGATFSSGELTAQSEQVSAQAVQIGNPIEEKKMVDCILKARDRNLYDAITDCGGGGLSSAVGEMGADTGVKVDLEKVPLKYEGLNYAEIWISEAQERMILAVPKNKIKALKEVFNKEDVEATVIGEFTNNKRLMLRYQGKTVCDLEMEFLHDGLPRIVRKAHWRKLKRKEPYFACPKDLTPYLMRILSSWNVCSKEWIVRQYDHEVQGSSVIKPLVGANNDGPSDAAVARPILSSKRGIAISNGINPKYGEIDPYWMAASCIDEALRQIIAVGGNLKEIALLDNFCWGDTNQPKQLGSLVRAAFGCYDVAKDYGAPFISGKDSLHNEYIFGKRRVSIPATLLISAIGVIDDVTKTVTMDFKEPGNLIYIVGDTYDEMGGSHYYAVLGAVGNSVPEVNAKRGRRLMDKLSCAIRDSLVKACHDCSEGGIGVAVAEMAFAGDRGAQIYLNKVPFRLKHKRGDLRRGDYILFSESNTRFIVEVREKDRKDFERTMKGIAIGLIGRVQYRKNLIVYGLYNKTVARAQLNRLKEAWQKPLRW
ncbi:MAG: phosphoribosylformylglycinamidine synthase subunit PurL [Candidatus Omnitrophota bacterium]